MNTVEERTPLLRYARRARARLAFVRGLEWAMRAAFYAGLVAFAAVASHKLFGMPMPILPAAIGLGAAILFIGFLCAFVPAVTLVEAAGAVDAAAGWKERLSSALALGRVDHPMEQALVDDIRARLGQRTPGDLFPLRAPRELRYLPLVAVAIIVAAQFVPSLDLFGVQAREKEKREQEKEIQVAIEKLKDQRRELEKAKEQQPSERLQQALAKIDQLMAELQKNPPPEKQEMLAQISKLADELQKMKNELAQAQAQAEKLQKAASKETSEQGEFGKLLREGKFKEAAQELAKLQKKMQDGKLSKEDQEKLKKQLERLAEKLKNEKDMSDMKDKLAKAMQGAEKGDQQAMDDLKQSLESLDGEMDEAESLAEALKDLENLAEAMAKDKKKCPSWGEEKDGQGGWKGGGSGWPGGLGRGRGDGWDEGEGDPGGPFGGPGQGEGGEAPESPDDVGIEKSKVKSQLGKGQYVGAYSMKGEPPKGTAAAEYADVQQKHAEQAMDALQKQKVPSAHRDFVRDYFDAIRIEKTGGK